MTRMAAVAGASVLVTLGVVLHLIGKAFTGAFTADDSDTELSDTY